MTEAEKRTEAIRLSIEMLGKYVNVSNTQALSGVDNLADEIIKSAEKLLKFIDPDKA